MLQLTLKQYFVRSLAVAAALGWSANAPAQAAKMVIGPPSPQPGDILKITLWPEAGEVLKGAGMSAFDTENVKFFRRPDGSARAFLGLPFDRNAGNFTVQARVQMVKDGRTTETIVRGTVQAVKRNFPTQRISMNSSTASTMNQKDKLRAEKALVQSKMKDTYNAQLWSGDWLVPTRGSSSSAYGRKRYVNGKWWGQHNGADIKAPSGADVVASNAGRVVLSQNLPTLRGNTIVIDHGLNVFTIYMHLSKRLVKEGDMVAKGQHIGDVGATGFVTGPHLHWEARVGWEPCDPFKLVREGLNF